MPRKEILDSTQKFSQPFCITEGEDFQLKNYHPGDLLGLKLARSEASELLRQGTEWLAQEQDVLYAQDRWSLLLVFQAMDAAGKDSTIKHVMSGVNPQGCQVFSFKQPSQEELNHDFMWRYSKCLPERGRIGIFNRSYYEERRFWDDYMHAYEETIRATASRHAPWFVVPADKRWFTRLVVVSAIVQAVEQLDLTYPKVGAEKKKELAAARAELAREQ
jgi:polyphosphate kinase 2 (PPK2 family)